MPKQVRAKFQCDSIQEFAGGWKEVKFSAVYSSSGENKDFADATPSGSLTIGISANAPAKDLFNPGKEYYLDFTEA